eukprot:3459840-Amphidinium_carterae.2
MMTFPGRHWHKWVVLEVLTHAVRLRADKHFEELKLSETFRATKRLTPNGSAERNSAGGMTGEL